MPNPHANVRTPFVTAFSASAIVGVAACTVGCTTRTQVFEGYDDDKVWNAMVATAKTPSYDDWKVMDNQVFAEPGEKSIEVYRVLRRTSMHPDSATTTEERDWRFRILLTHDAVEGHSSPTGTVNFTARQLAVPAHVWKEADRYFAQVRVALDQPAEAPAEAPAAKPE